MKEVVVKGFPLFPVGCKFLRNRKDVQCVYGVVLFSFQFAAK